jgi:RNA polymerase sigma-70 factor, ECF subfamily
MEIVESRDSERALLAGLKAGDEATYAVVIRQVTPVLLRRLRGFKKRYETATEPNDHLQLAFLKLYKDRQTLNFDDLIKLRAWLYKTASRAYLSEIRKANVADFYGEHVTELYIKFKTQQSDITDDLIAFSRALSTLKEDDVYILYLRHMEGQSSPEIAKQVDKTPDAVRAQLKRAMDKIKARLDIEPNSTKGSTDKPRAVREKDQ